MTGDLFADLPGDGASIEPSTTQTRHPERSEGSQRKPSRSSPLVATEDTPASRSFADAQDDNTVGESEGPVPFRALEVDVVPGVSLVEASAGTGKTYALTELVLRLVLDPAVPDLTGDDGLPDLRKLLVVTFTVAATEELKTRIRRALRLALDAFETAPAEPPALVAPFLERFGADEASREASEHRLRRALAQSGEAAVFTIHGFCKRVLERSAFEGGEPFAFDFTEDAERLRQRAARDVWHALAARHPGLGPLAVAAGWSLDRLLEHAGHATRFDRTRVVPEAAPLADALDAVEAARDALRDAWDAAAQLAVVPDEFYSRSEKSHGDLAADRPGLFARVAAFAAGDDRHLDAVQDATTEKVVDAISYKNRSGPKKAAEDAVTDPGFLACDAVVAALDALERALVHAFVGDAEAAYRRLKETAGVLTFDDLVDRLDRALAEGAPTRAALVRSIQAQYAVALIDEFQDTDPKQYRIFRTAFEGRPLVFIGDPKQAIYAFRGADVFAYLGAKADARAPSFTLDTNYRSAPRLVEAVNAVFGRLGETGRPFVYDGIPFRPVRPRADAEAGIRGVETAAPLVWWSAGDLKTNRRGEVSKDPARRAAQEAVVTEVCRLLNDPAVEIRDEAAGGWRRLAAGDLAVLVRKNQQAWDLQDALRRAGVPSVVAKGDDIRASREMDELERVLRAVARPGDRRAVRAALATEMWGWTAADLAAEGADDRVEAVAQTLRRDRAVWREHGVFRMLTGLFRREDVYGRLQGYLDRERRLTNLRHAVELVHDAERSEGRSPDELLHWVRTRDSRTFAQASAVEMRLESDADAVQLVTMHNAKGLEYPVVFAPFVWDEGEKETWFGTFVERPPVAHVEGGASAVYDLGSEDQERHRALAEAERLAESLRLTYVALTRAKERLYVMWGPLSGAHMSGLGHLLRNLPVPLTGDGLAALDAATKAAAAKALPTSLAFLEEWIAADDLHDRMAVRPLPSGGGAVEARAAAPAGGRSRSVGRDLAERAGRAASTGSFSGWTAGVEADARHDDADDPVADAPEAGIFAFAAGARAGTCLHEVLQFADFSAPDAYRDPESEAAARVARTLRLHGLHTARPHRRPLPDPARVVCEMVARLAAVEIHGLGFSLRDVDTDPRVRDTEWQFHVPRSAETPARIADVVEAHGDDDLRAYAPALRRLASADAEDLFTGIADLVVQHPAPASDDDPGGPFYVLDWKSNHLGPTAAHYGADAVGRAMRAHHYLLQAHLYVVGLHRHLRARLGEAYDYDRHVGGVAYVFLRGVAEDGRTGFWTSRPPRALVEALDALLFADA